VFAVNSAVHSYLILAYTDADSVALNVGFYYMANAGGRLLGTLLSGFVFQQAGFQGCLWGSFLLVLLAALLSMGTPASRQRAHLGCRGRWGVISALNKPPQIGISLEPCAPIFTRVSKVRSTGETLSISTAGSWPLASSRWMLRIDQ